MRLRKLSSDHQRGRDNCGALCCAFGEQGSQQQRPTLLRGGKAFHFCFPFAPAHACESSRAKEVNARGGWRESEARERDKRWFILFRLNR
jgi:hypothetical protein